MNNLFYREAQRLAKKYQTRDPFELLAAMNVVVGYSDAYPQNGLKGYCTVMNRMNYVMINSRLPELDQRVVAAHEAGHLVLHRDDLKVGAFKDDDIYMAIGKKEREANFFASDFMIEDEEVLDHMQAQEADYFSVAKALCVPAPFLAFKLYSMVQRGIAQMRIPVELNSTFLAK